MSDMFYYLLLYYFVKLRKTQEPPSPHLIICIKVINKWGARREQCKYEETVIDTR